MLDQRERERLHTTHISQFQILTKRVRNKMTRGMVRENKNIEKQMGCMAGFLNIFDRHHMLAGKRIYSAKTLPPSSAPQEIDSSPEPEKSGASHAESTPAPSTPDRVTQPPTPEATPLPKTPVPLSVFEFKEGTRSPWKFAREAPRLSLDSRAVVDAKGTLHPRENRTIMAPLPPAEMDKQRKSTSVIARLMGLDEPSPDSDPEPEQKLELRRSASESRVHRDLSPNHQYRFFDTNGFQLKQLSSRDNGGGFGGVNDRLSSNGRDSDPKLKCFPVRNSKTEPARANLRNRGTVQKKSFYDSADFFPDAKQSISIDGEIERRLKMRGIDEPSKDLEKLKQILEALQLKGLLHSKNYAPPTNRRNLVVDGSISRNDSPIVVMKPRRLSGSFNRTGRFASDSPPPSSFGSSPRARRDCETIPLVSPRRERPEADNRNARAASQARARTFSSPTRGESGVRSPSRIGKVNDAVVDTVNRRISPVHSAKQANSRMNSPELHMMSRSPRMRRGSILKEEKVTIGVGEDEASTISESSFSTSSHTDTERLKMDEYRVGRNLLERCDKLLNSIAEITAARQAELQPSPVSVLDWSFYKEESSCSPSPVMKRCIDYKEQAVDSEDDMWSGALCYSEAKSDESTEDNDFVYVSEIMRACSYLPEGGSDDIFLLLEKQQYLKGNDTSKLSTLRRRLIFDTVHEILHRNRRLPPWKEATWAENTSLLHRIWSEFRRIREREEEEVSEEMLEVICGVLKKDVAEDGVKEWGEWPVEMGDVVLDMERLVFKDLIGDTIRELASSCKGQQFNRPVTAFRRKLLF